LQYPPTLPVSTKPRFVRTHRVHSCKHEAKSAQREFEALCSKRERDSGCTYLVLTVYKSLHVTAQLKEAHALGGGYGKVIQSGVDDEGLVTNRLRVCCNKRGNAYVALRENGVDAGQALFRFQANLNWALWLALSKRLQFAVVFPDKMSADFVVENGLDAPLSIRPTQQQPAAGKHCRCNNAGVPSDGDQVIAAQAGEVGAYAPVDFVGWKKSTVAVLFPLRPTSELREHAPQ